MHAEYDESELPIPPERRRTRPNRIGQNDPPIAAGKEALAFFARSVEFYDIAIVGGRLTLLEPGTERKVLDFWAHFCPEEAI